MVKKLVIFLVRKKLGLKKKQAFKFDNQSSAVTFYYFDDDKVMKGYASGKSEPSSVSLNWLLNDDCKITIL